MIITVKTVGSIVEMILMITEIIKFHSQLNKGEAVKIITTQYETYIDKTDLVKIERRHLLIFRADGCKIAINNRYIVACCVVRRSYV